MRPRRIGPPARLVALAACGWAAAGPAARAQQNPIVTATQAPAPIASQSLIGIYPGGYPPYGSFGPYGGGYPYSSYNPSLTPLTNPPQQTNQAVPGQPTQPGQTQTPATQQGLQAFTQGGGSGGGGSGGGGSGGSGSSPSGGTAGTAGGNAADGASYELLQDPGSPLYRRYERASGVTAPLRPQVLAQIGRGKGVRQGFSDEVGRIAAALQGPEASRLDDRYDFSRQMIGAHLVPPVIGEVHHVKESDGDRVLYLTVGAYQIVRPARLVISPPNWRDYLLVDVAGPETAVAALEPQSADEQSVYDQAYQAGLAKGILEARDTFEDNLNRLERDYGGMSRYHELAKQGAVSLPVVDDSRRAVRVAEDGKRAFVGERVVTLTVTPRFRAAGREAFK